MAEPITEIRQLPEEPVAERLRREWPEKLAAHEEALAELLRVVEALHEHGLLRLAAGVLEQADRVGRVAVEELAQPRNLRALGSLVALYELAAQCDPGLLKASADVPLQALREARAAAAGSRRIGILGLWRALKDPDVNRGVQLVLAFLRGLGRAVQAGASRGADVQQAVPGASTRAAGAASQPPLAGSGVARG